MSEAGESSDTAAGVWMVTVWILGTIALAVLVRALRRNDPTGG